MIKTFKSRKLERFYNNDRSKINAKIQSKLENILLILDAATTVRELDYSGSELHPLKGDMKGYWSVKNNEEL